MAQALSTNQVIAVIGAGTMGAGIAQVAAQAGHVVKLVDIRPHAASDAIELIRKQLLKQVTKAKLSEADAHATLARLIAQDSIQGLHDAALVIEAIVENLETKQQLFVALESIVRPNCILASNTSSISITAIASVLKNPRQLAGLHFFNPAPLMALVEVIQGISTGTSVLETLYATVNQWGKTAVYAKSTPGFIVNRVARPFYGEALRLAQEGVADFATIDACLREAGGFRMGAFELMDLIGLDVNFAVTQSVWHAYFNDPRYQPSIIQREFVAAGYLGRKTGKGFFDYGADAPAPQPQTCATAPLAKAINIYGESPAALALVKRLQAQPIEIEHLPAQTDQPNLLACVDSATLCSTDGRSATLHAHQTATPNLVLIDHALDYAGAKRLAIAAALQCSTTAQSQAIALLQAAGFSVSCIADTPGLIVMRTIAMLVNEASDAIHQGVADARSIDLAMRLGANYPQGPLQWAQSIGLQNLAQVLAQLAAFYGEDRYRVSPLLQHKVLTSSLFYDTTQTSRL